VLVGGVVGDPVEHDLQPGGVRLRHQAVGVLERAEHRVDVAVVAHVVAEVGHRGPVDGGEPDGVDPQPDQVVEVPAEPLQVADPVAVRVRERPGVDLVDHR
jgi:hypothetical protein